MTDPARSASPTPFHIEDVATLGRSALLGALPVDEVGRILELLEHLEVAPGERVDRAEGTLCFVLEGEAEELPPHPRTLGPGQHFGARELAGSTLRTEVIARTSLRLGALTRPVFERLAAIAPGAALHLSQGLLVELASELDLRLPRAAELVRPTTGVIVSPEPSPPPLDLATPGGRDVFRRSAGLAFLEAARRAGAPLVRLHASMTTGQVALIADEGTAAWAARIEQELSALVADDTPIALEVWPAPLAIADFTARGWLDAADLVASAYRPYVEVVRCGEVRALAQGPVLPTAGPLAGVRVLPHSQGLLLDLGDRLRTHVPRGKMSTLVLESRSPRYGAEMTQDERAWLGKLGVTSVGAFNRACVSGRTRQIVHVAEGYHEKRIAQMADDVRAHGSVRVVGIAGPSSSGKTTFIKRLKIQLEICGLRPRELSLDDYFLDRERTPRDAAGEYDFEALEALDLELLDRHLEALVAGRAVRTARFDFRTGKSHPDGGPDLTLGEGDVLLVEGLHALNPRILVAAPAEVTFRIFVHPAQSLPYDRLSILEPADVRLVRRIVRDRHQRGTDTAASLARWRSVRRAERLHVFPQLVQADRVFDTSLIYEPSVLKVYAERYLLEVPREHPEAVLAHRLRRLLEPFVPIDPDEVPPTSILREFIGKSGFSY